MTTPICFLVGVANAVVVVVSFLVSVYGLAHHPLFPKVLEGIRVAGHAARAGHRSSPELHRDSSYHRRHPHQLSSAFR
jgi:hypothetical protein